MNVVVEPAKVEDKAVLRRLLELYLYDFTEFLPHDLNEHGEFGYQYLDHYWAADERETRLPFLVRADGKLAGFALVRRKAGGPWTMAEFFVMRKYRRGGVGSRAAREVFARCPGAWKVSEVTANTPAQAFWRRVIGAATGGRFTEEESEKGVTQAFTIAG
ncbi:MAG: GNAT family N-acetyltransferase [Chloroflexi bacterium]|nr:GNAT family N-acetyltransferase [Chloroflexota bacterium]